MPAVFRVRREFDALWREENQLLPVQITSAIELDESVATAHRRGDRPPDRARGAAHEHRRPRRPRGHRPACGQLDPRRLHPHPTRTTSQAGCRRIARRRSRRHLQHADQARRDHQHPQEPDRGPGRRQRRAHRGRHRPVRGRRHRPRPRPGELHGLRDARAAPRRDGAGPQPRVRQRRRRAVRRLGEGRRGRHGQAHRAACSRSRSATSCWAASSTRSAARSTARATSTRPRRARPSSRRRASSSASR